MSNRGKVAWVTDRWGYRCDPLDPQSLGNLGRRSQTRSPSLRGGLRRVNSKSSKRMPDQLLRSRSANFNAPGSGRSQLRRSEYLTISRIARYVLVQWSEARARRAAFR